MIEKKFYSIVPKNRKKPLAVEAYIPAIRLLAKYYGVRVRFYSARRFKTSGLYCIRTQTIKLLKKEYGMFSAFFHELGHHHCVTNGKWVAYHSSIRNFADLQKHRRTALKTERWVDRWAEKEMKKWLPHMEYGAGYNEPSDAKWLKNHLNPYYEEVAKRLQETN